MPLLLGLALLFLNVFLQINLHEFGHFLTGKALRYRLIAYRIGFLSWDYENGRMRFSLRKNKGYSGLCGMIPREDSPPHEQLWYIAGGTLTTGISLLIFALVYFRLLQVGHPFTPYWASFVVLPTLAIILLNGLPLSFVPAPTDGKIFFSLLRRDPDSERILALFKATALLQSGLRPRELPSMPELPASLTRPFAFHNALLNYFSAMDGRNLHEMKSILSKVEDALPGAHSYILPGIYNELIFYYSFFDLKPDLAQRYYKANRRILDRDMDSNGRRVTAGYRAFVQKDREGALFACREGLQHADSFPIPGQARMETDLIQDVLNRLDLPDL